MIRPTMADVARAAGVSVMTVSYTYSRPARVSQAGFIHDVQSGGPGAVGELARVGASAGAVASSPECRP